jgi:hypothetical protein
MARPRNTDALKDVACPNRDCVDYGLTGGENVKGSGKTKKGAQRYKCKSCGRTFTASTGTFSEGLKTPPLVVYDALGRVADGIAPAKAARQLGVSTEAVRGWVKGFDPFDPFFVDWVYTLNGFERLRLEMLQAELTGKRHPLLVAIEESGEEDRRQVAEWQAEEDSAENS